LISISIYISRVLLFCYSRSRISFLLLFSLLFFFNDTATTEIYTLSLHDALPIYAWTDPAHDSRRHRLRVVERGARGQRTRGGSGPRRVPRGRRAAARPDRPRRRPAPAASRRRPPRPRAHVPLRVFARGHRPQSRAHGRPWPQAGVVRGADAGGGVPLPGR